MKQSSPLLCILFLLAFSLFAAPLSAQQLDRACAQLREEIAAARNALSATRERIGFERAALRKNLLQAELELTQEEAQIFAREKENKTLGERLDRQRLDRRLLQENLRRCVSQLREQRKELEGVVLRVRPAGSLFSDLDSWLDKALETQDDVNLLEGSAKLWAIQVMHLQHCRQPRQFRSKIVQPDGRHAQADVLNLPGFGGIGRLQSGEVGLVSLSPGEETYRLRTLGFNKRQREEILQAFTASDPLLTMPVDITGGLASARLAQERTLLQFLEAGGPVVIPLLAIALIALIMVLERTIYLTRINANIDQALNSVLPYLERDDFAQALQKLNNSKSPVLTVLREGIRQGQKSTENLEEFLQQVILGQMPKLERFLGALGVFAAIAPLLGLLGTVSGMIGTFQIITLYGTGNPRMLSGGIGEALITTELGLIIAVPILLMHAWCSRRVRTVVAHMDRAAIGLIGVLRQKRSSGEPEQKREPTVT